MSTEPDTFAAHPEGCGCCEGLAARTPVEVENRPGLAAFVYRAGTHAQFRETMIARLSDASRPALQKLNTREQDDFSIALLDAWGVVSDVLTFYQERVANESYLGTATERRSVLELARLIGYEPRPGVAASTLLAFTLEDAPGSGGQALSLGTTAQVVPHEPPPLVLEAGAKAQSVPGPGEHAQIFETVEEIETSPRWNAMRPRLTQPQEISTGLKFVVLKGTSTNLKRGDTLLVVAGAGADGRATMTALDVTTNDTANTTRVDFLNTPPPLPRHARPSHLAEGRIGDFPAGTPLDERVVRKIIARTWNAEDLSALALVQGWPVAQLVANINEQTARRDAGAGVFAFRQRASAFGHNAPKYKSLPAVLRLGETVRSKPAERAYPFDWENRLLDHDAFNAPLRIVDIDDIRSSAPRVTLAAKVEQTRSLAQLSLQPSLRAPLAPRATRRFVYLDNAYPAIVKGGWVVLRAPSGEGLVEKSYAVVGSVELTRSDFTLSTKVSRLTLAAAAPFGPDFKMRTTSVLAQSERLGLADLPVRDAIEGNGVVLDRAHLGLKVGRRVILTGERADLAGVFASEALTLKEATIEAGFTVLVFEETLAHTYLRETVTINANVARATHGETVGEVLGGGDAARAFQSFTLRQPPLTYTPAPTPSGGETTLEVRVNDVLWHELPTLFGRGPEERVYVTRTGDDGRTTVQFGDGRTGARLPTGQDNVSARYRRGTGVEGLVKAHQLTQLMTRPLGLKGVTNPLASAGAEDSESRDAARRNAPLAVLTLDRVVSLRDYEHFASAFGGVAKSLATWTWSAERRGVFVTVAGPDGAPIEEGGALHKNLLDAMRAAGDPHVPLTVATYQPRRFRLRARVRVHPDHLPGKVLQEVERVLRARFSFEARAFGQPVTLGEILAAIHSVAAVVAVDVDELYRAGGRPALRARLAASLPAPGPAQFVAAELLTLDSRPLELEVMA